MARRCELTGKAVATGNNVSHANNRTRRRFLPNLQHKALFSDVLGESVALRVSAYALRVIERKGGLDAYLASAPDSALSLRARRLKRRIAKAQAARAA